MLFHSHEFLLLLAATLAAFRAAPVPTRPAVLLLASLVFYGYAGIGMLALFIAVAGLAYVSLRRIEAGQRIWLHIGVTGILANLLFFKYTVFLLDALTTAGVPVAPVQNWAARTLILPVGISFYSFQLIAVLIDAARGQRLGVRSFRELLLFIMFFGHLIAGPIMRGREFFPQLHVLPGPTRTQVATGIVLLLTGLVKKVVFADALLADRVNVSFGAGPLSTGGAWLAALLFGFQIYFDFSGYVDMALGMSRLFGLELMPNFATPYVSRSPSEFWRRWNITLSRWFGDYVYIPLGGSHASLIRTIRNVIVTMALSGLWHGAGWTFLVWGLIHGVYLAAFHVARRAAPSWTARLTTGNWQWCGWVVTFAVTTIAWVYFRSPDVHTANAIVTAMIRGGTGASPIAPGSGFLLVAALLALHFAEAWWAPRSTAVVARAADVWLRVPGPLQAVVAFPILFITIALTKVVHGAFIYFQF